MYAVDIWEQALAHLKHRTASVDNVEIICRSAEALEFSPASLDKVVCFDTLHELPKPKEALKRWARFLKPGGKLLYRDPSIPSERIGSLSEGQLRHSESIRGVDVFVQQVPSRRRGSRV